MEWTAWRWTAGQRTGEHPFLGDVALWMDGGLHDDGEFKRLLIVHLRSERYLKMYEK